MTHVDPPFQLREGALVDQSWRDRLNAASSEGEVVDIARDFVARFSPDDINRLPEPCRPGKFFDAGDVSGFAFALARHHCADGRPIAALVGRLANFFSEASTRLSHILAHSNKPDIDPRRSA